MQRRLSGWLLRIGPERAMGLVCLVCLLLFAYHFHLERTTCYDSGFQVWRIIDAGAPNAEHHRWSVIPAQLAPLFLLWAGASLSTFLKVYSVCLALVPLAVFTLLAWRWNDLRAVIALPIGLVASTSLAFHFGVSEVYQGLPAPFLFGAALRRALDAPDQRAARNCTLAATACALWAVFYHSVLVLPLLFVLGHELGVRRAWRQRRVRIVVALSVAVVAVRVLGPGATDYEKERTVGLGELLDQFPHIGELGSTVYLLSIAAKFKAFFLLVGISTVLCTITRNWWSLAWTSICASGTLMLILIADRDVGSPYMYENPYPLIGAMWSMCFAECAGQLRERMSALGRVAAMLVLCIGLVQVWRGHYFSTWKVQHAQRMTRELHARGVKKAIISSKVMHWAYDHTHWTFPFETALVSATEGASRTVSIFADDPLNNAFERIDNPNEFLGPTWSMGWFTIDKLPWKYFDLRGAGYQLVTAMPDSANMNIDPVSCSLWIADTSVILEPAPFTVITAMIENRSGRVLPSLGHDRVNGLLCQVFDINGRTIVAEDFAPLEMDLPGGARMQQAVIIGRPKGSGRYTARVELVVNGLPSGVRQELGIAARTLGF